MKGILLSSPRLKQTKWRSGEVAKWRGCRGGPVWPPFFNMSALMKKINTFQEKGGHMIGDDWKRAATL